MTLDDILLLIDRAAERMTSSGGGEVPEWDALVQYLAPAILGSPTLLREAVQRAWSSGLTWQPFIVTQVQAWLERPLDLDDGEQRVSERIRRMLAARTAAVQDGLGAADQAIAARVADLDEIAPAPGWEERAVERARAAGVLGGRAEPAIVVDGRTYALRHLRDEALADGGTTGVYDVAGIGEVRSSGDLPGAIRAARKLISLSEFTARSLWQDAAIRAWRNRAAALQHEAEVSGDDARYRRLLSTVERVPEHLRAAYEWMDGVDYDWAAMTGDALEEEAYEQQEAARTDAGLEVPAEAIIALAAWLRSGDVGRP